MLPLRSLGLSANMMNVSYLLVLRKAAWGAVLAIGLTLAYYGVYPLLKYTYFFAPMEAPTAIPAPVEQAMRLPPKVTMGSKEAEQLPPVQAGGGEIVLMAPPPQKDWMDYGDKIVGWIVALAGAFKLIQRSPTTPESVPETVTPAAAPRKKK